MKPNFALNLTEDRIGLLHRTGQGWMELGTAIFGAPDMDATLARLLHSATELSPRGMSSKIVIPNSQILYATLSVDGTTDAEKRAEIKAALAGRTPYAVDDLAFDWAGDGPQVQVAVVAQETLDEAEGFGVQYGFRPLSFVAIPDAGDFAGEPMFGMTKVARGILGKGRQLQRDTDAIRLIGPLLPEAEVVAVPTPEPEPEAEPEPVSDAVVAVAPPVEVWAGTQAAPEPVPPAEPDAPLAEPVPDHEPQVVSDSAASDSDTAAAAPPDGVDLPAPRFTITSGSATPGVAANSVPDVVDEAPFAEVSDQDATAASGDDVPPAPSIAAQMAFNSRRAATDANPVRPVGAAPPRASAIPMPGLLADRIAARAQGTAPGGDTARGNSGGFVTALSVPGSKKRKPIVGGSAAAAPGAASAAATDTLPRKPLTKPGGTFASSTPVRGKPRYLGLILTGILILFLALVAAWSSFFIASQDKPATGTDVAAADVPAVDDEMLADGQDPLPDLPAADTAAVAPEPAPALPAAEVASGPDPAPPAPDAAPAADVTASAGPAPETGVDVTGPAPVLADAPTDEIVLSTADTPLAPQEAADLGVPAALADVVPAAQMAPPPFGTVYAFNPNGTIKAVPEGIMTPEGIRLVAGQPQRVPGSRPATIAAAAAVAPVPVQPDVPVATDEPTVIVSDPALADARPRRRPANLQLPAPAVPGSADGAALVTDQPLRAGSPRPAARPATVLAAGQDAHAATEAASLATASAAAGSAAEAAVLAVVAEPASALTPSGSRLAVSVSRIPTPRPRNLQKAVEAALAAATRAPPPEPEPEPRQAAAATAPEADAEPEITGSASQAPSSGSVADQATFANALNMSQLNLIGVYGSQSNRYALLRQPNGRYKRVQVGDRIDGGTIAAITASEVRYQKGGRLIALRMPGT